MYRRANGRCFTQMIAYDLLMNNKLCIWPLDSFTGCQAAHRLKKIENLNTKNRKKREKLGAK